MDEASQRLYGDAQLRLRIARRVVGRTPSLLYLIDSIFAAHCPLPTAHCLLQVPPPLVTHVPEPNPREADYSSSCQRTIVPEWLTIQEWVAYVKALPLEGTYPPIAGGKGYSTVAGKHKAATRYKPVKASPYLGFWADPEGQPSK